jgi:hypothetical protein
MPSNSRKFCDSDALRSSLALLLLLKRRGTIGQAVNVVKEHAMRCRLSAPM